MSSFNLTLVVVLSAIIVTFHGAVKTRSAASGSPEMFASATGLTLPGTFTAPPINTTSLTFLVRFGSNFMASARFVNLPTARIVICPGLALTVSAMNRAAGWASGRTLRDG